MNKRLNVAHLADKLTSIRRELHQYPELSSQEFETTKRIKRWLREIDCTILPFELETGVVAEIQGSGVGPTVAFRADIDALPILEQTGLSYASKHEGISHACGHDFHTTIALGAAFVLAEHKHLFRGRVRFIFQPAEETTQGAKYLIEQGLFRDGKVSAIFGLHNQPLIPAGKFGVTSGHLMAAVDTLHIKIIGKSGHGAIPEKTIDAVVAGSAIVLGLQSAVSRNIDPFEPVVITVGSFHAGTTHNVIAGKAELLGTVRSFNPKVREQLPELIERIANHIAAGYGARAEVKLIPQVPAIQNDEQLTDLVKQSLIELYGQDCLVDPQPTMGGEDFSLYQEHVPGCFFWVGTKDEDKQVTKQWHDPAFLVDDQLLPNSVEAVSYILIKSLEQLA